MKYEKMQIMVDGQTDVFKVQKCLDNKAGIINTKVVTADSIWISFDAHKIAAKKICKLIGHCSSNPRKNNILSIRRNEGQQNEASS